MAQPKGFKCRHVKQDGISPTSRIITINGWRAVLCQYCVQMAEETKFELEVVFKKHSVHEKKP